VHRCSELDVDRLRPSGALLATQLALSAAIERCAVEGTGHDATTMDLLVRLQLAPGHELRAVDLCDQLLKSPSHISRLLDRAEAAGLVSRQPDPADRRASLVRLGDDGREVVSRFGPRLQSVLDQSIHDVLDDGDIEVLVDLLERIEVAARSCSAGAAAGNSEAGGQSVGA